MPRLPQPVESIDGVCFHHPTLLLIPVPDPHRLLRVIRLPDLHRLTDRRH